MKILANWGLDPVRTGPKGKPQQYLAAKDSARHKEFVDSARSQHAVLWCSRGGYGSARLLSLLARTPGLDFRKSARTVPLAPLKARHRSGSHRTEEASANVADSGSTPGHAAPLLLGFSDVTALLSFCSQRLGWRCIHAPNVTTLPSLDEESLSCLHDYLFRGIPPEFGALEPLVVRRGRERSRLPTKVSGLLVPMNLSTLCSLLGTPYAPDLSGRILVLEDVGEPAYRIDRMMNQLARSDGFEKLSGIVLGDMDDALNSVVLRNTFDDLCRGPGIPVACGFPIGHGPRNFPVPIETPATFHATSTTCRLVLD